MKRKILVAITAIQVLMISLSAAESFPILLCMEGDKKNICVYENGKGELAFNTYFHYANEFASNGLAAIEVNGKWGYIDIKGNVVIPAQFDDCWMFTENGLARVLINGKYGYINKEGKIVISAKFSDAKDFSTNGLAAVNVDGKYSYNNTGKYGYINTQGEMVIPAQFKNANSFASNGLAEVLVEEGWFHKETKGGYINEKGEMVIPAKYTSYYIKDFGANGLAPIDVGMNTGMSSVRYSKWGYMNAKGEMVIPAQFSDAQPFTDDGLAVVGDGIYSGFIDTSGKIVIKPKYMSAMPFHNGVAKVDLAGKGDIYITKNGTEYTSKVYNALKFASTGEELLQTLLSKDTKQISQIEKNQAIEMIESCLVQNYDYYNDSNLYIQAHLPKSCLSAINNLKNNKSAEGIFFDYIIKQSGDIAQLKDAINNINYNRKSNIHETKKLPDFNTWVLLEYIDADARVIRKNIGMYEYDMPGAFGFDYVGNELIKARTYKSYITNSEKLTQNFQDYSRLINKIPNVDKDQIHERMRLMAPNKMTYSLDAYSKSNYGKYFMPYIKKRYSASFKQDSSNYSVSVVIPPFTEKTKRLNIRENTQMYKQYFTVQNPADCKKTGTDSSTENVWSGNIKSKNVFYDVYTCEIPQKDRQIVQDLVNNSNQKNNDIFSKWNYQTVNHYTYNYYTDSELRAMHQNSASSNPSSSSSTQSTESSSSSSSSSSNSRGMKNVRSAGTYIGYPSWSIECNNGSSRNMFLDRNGHWHANGSTIDMGSYYDSWSKEKVADYICKEL